MTYQRTGVLAFGSLHLKSQKSARTEYDRAAKTARVGATLNMVGEGARYVGSE